MKKMLFIDTWGWVVIHNRRESRHSEVHSYYRKWRLNGGSICTTDYVLDETYTLIFRRLPFTKAVESLKLLDEAVEQGYLNVERISFERFDKAKKLRLKFSDKPKISFTDFTSMVVMKELELEFILTDDEHFRYVGFGFQKMP